MADSIIKKYHDDTKANVIKRVITADSLISFLSQVDLYIMYNTAVYDIGLGEFTWGDQDVFSVLYDHVGPNAVNIAAFSSGSKFYRSYYRHGVSHNVYEFTGTAIT